MRTFSLFCVIALLPLGAAEPTKSTLTKTDFERFMKELSNWGRWGEADERGAMNLITPEKRREAASLVREGVPVSLSHPAEKEKAVDNPRPFVHEMTAIGTTPNAGSHGDLFTIAHHGLAHTHLDALCHFFYEGRMYNGFSRAEVTAQGAAKLSVFVLHNGIFSRAVLMDIPRLKGVPYLEPGTAIYPEDLDAWEKQAGVRVTSGDVVLIRTGRWARRAEKGPWTGGLAGLHMTAARWLKSRDVAVLGGDGAQDVRPSGVEGVSQPIHLLALVAMGMPILDNCDLEELSKAAEQRKRWEFLITAAPLAVPGATGSALNPIAIF